MAKIRLTQLNYIERKGRPLEWSLEGLDLGEVNLLVGKNATGKTRILTLIANLAQSLLLDKLHFREAAYDAIFDCDGTDLKYSLHVENERVVKESLIQGDSVLIDRDSNRLKIVAEEIGKEITFKPSSKEVSAAARRDKLQHPFLQPLNEWAQSVRRYQFGRRLGQDSMAIVLKNKSEGTEIVDRDEDNVVAIFMKGRDEFGDDYQKAILSDMKKLGYNLSEINTGTPEGVSVNVKSMPLPLADQLLAIGVREDGVEGMIFQRYISQGMFRTLSILVQIHYAKMSNRASCILIDDIGEGLDFDRSSLLIDLLRAKAIESGIQLIMATNDQYVMNHVPLEEWSVLQRNGSHVAIKNIHNSKEQFDEFKFVGMSNFTFFEMDFLNGGPVEEDAIQHE